MRIHYMSDLHLEFDALDRPLPDGEILLLGGDVTLMSVFDKGGDAYYADRGAVLRERTEAFLDQCRSSFERIFYLIGNHEAYGYDLSKTPRMIRSKLEGVELLENKAVDLGKDVVLVGATLWTDMNKGLDAFAVGRGMNDFCGAIVVEDKEGTQAHDGSRYARRFRTGDAIARFNRSKRFIARTAKANSDKTIVVATHHAPSVQGISPEHMGRSRINAGYYTPLESFIGSHPNIRWWVHGHTHLQKAYQIGQALVLSNARGYIGQEASADAFDPDCWFDPITGKRSKGPPTDEEIAAEMVAHRASLEPMSSAF